MNDLSVIIVSYNVQAFLERTLDSLFLARRELNLEVIVVDNASSDRSIEMVQERFPQVKLICLRKNLGFAKANNLGLQLASGRYLMLLNPDCRLQEDSLVSLVEFLESHTDAGAVGPKILNQDGSFQSTSKRGLPTPWTAFCKLSGLASLFPKSPWFNKYGMGYLDENEIHEVEVLSGAAFMIRAEVYQRIGGLDEDYFMFGEDIEWSRAISEAGWKLYYLPTTHITHYKGQSSRLNRSDRDKHFYQAMRLYARKHFRGGIASRICLEAGILIVENRRHLKIILPIVLFGFALVSIVAYFAKRTRISRIALVFTVALGLYVTYECLYKIWRLRQNK